MTLTPDEKGRLQQKHRQGGDFCVCCEESWPCMVARLLTEHAKVQEEHQREVEHSRELWNAANTLRAELEQAKAKLVEVQTKLHSLKSPPTKHLTRNTR